jgi:hypothetical protein
MNEYPIPRSMRQTATWRQVMVPPARPGIFSLAWRWRYELAGLAGAGAGTAVVISAAGVAGLAGAIAAACLLAGLITAWPPARQLTLARFWCIVTPHRIRAGCTQAWVQSRTGKIPIVLLTRAQPFGERVWLWCRAGTCPQDLISAREQLAVACWARGIRVMPGRRYRQIAIVDVIRREDRAAETRGEPGWPVPQVQAGDLDGVADVADYDGRPGQRNAA